MTRKIQSIITIILTFTLLLSTASAAYASSLPLDVSEDSSIDLRVDEEDGANEESIKMDVGEKTKTSSGGDKPVVIKKAQSFDLKSNAKSESPKKPFALKIKKANANPNDYSPSDFASLDDAVTKFKTVLKNKEPSTVLLIKTQEYDSVETLRAALLTKIGEHTGVGSEGDYLRFNSWTEVHGEQFTAESQNTSDPNKYYIFDFSEILYYLTTEEEKELTDTAQEIADALKGDTDHETVQNIHDYIIDTVSYDNEHDNTYLRKFTAYAALFDDTAVCEGYALLFYRLCLANGIDARYITGHPSNSSEAHAWNIVKLGDKYYNVDTTWDANSAQAGGAREEYFLIGKKNFTQHIRDAEYTTTKFNTDYPMSEDDYSTSDIVLKINEKPEDGIIVREVEVDEEEMFDPFTIPLTYTYEGPAIAGVIWDSSNDAVAGVSNEGVVTIRDLGETIISLSAGSDASDSLTIKIVAKYKPLQQITNIESEEEEATVNVGDVYTFDITTTPSGTDVEPVLWESSDPNIASVEQDGMITALAPGTTTITAKAQSGLASKMFTIHILGSGSDNTGEQGETTDTDPAQVEITKKAMLLVNDEVQESDVYNIGDRVRYSITINYDDEEGLDALSSLSLKDVHNGGLDIDIDTLSVMVGYSAESGSDTTGAASVMNQLPEEKYAITSELNNFTINFVDVLPDDAGEGVVANTLMVVYDATIAESASEVENAKLINTATISAGEIDTKEAKCEVKLPGATDDEGGSGGDNQGEDQQGGDNNNDNQGDDNNNDPTDPSGNEDGQGTTDDENTNDNTGDNSGSNTGEDENTNPADTDDKTQDQTDDTDGKTQDEDGNPNDTNNDNTDTKDDADGNDSSSSDTTNKTKTEPPASYRITQSSGFTNTVQKTGNTITPTNKTTTSSPATLNAGSGTTTPTKSTVSTAAKTSPAQTGDVNQMPLYGAALILSVFAIVAVSKRRKANA